MLLQKFFIFVDTHEKSLFPSEQTNWTVKHEKTIHKNEETSDRRHRSQSNAIAELFAQTYQIEDCKCRQRGDGVGNRSRELIIVLKKNKSKDESVQSHKLTKARSVSAVIAEMESGIVPVSWLLHSKRTNRKMNQFNRTNLPNRGL